VPASIPLVLGETSQCSIQDVISTWRVRDTALLSRRPLPHAPIQVHIRVAKALLGGKAPYAANHVHMDDNPIEQLHASLTAEGGRTGRESNIAISARLMRMENAMLRNGALLDCPLQIFATASAACHAQCPGGCRLCRLPLFEEINCGSDVKMERLRGLNGAIARGMKCPAPLLLPSTL
jgi:hypothetical protein